MLIHGGQQIKSIITRNGLKKLLLFDLPVQTQFLTPKMTSLGQDQPLMFPAFWMDSLLHVCIIVLFRVVQS